MYSILNRLRGTWSWMAKVNGAILGLIFYLYSADIYVSISISIAYVIGESFGWGKWIAGVYKEHREPATSEMIRDEDGRNNGIHYIANLIVGETENYYQYCMIALTIRGMYWFSITMLPLLFSGYISIIEYAVMSVALGYGFPLSVKLGAITERALKKTGTNIYWEYSEVWYGLVQDFGIIAIAVILGGN